MTQEREQLLSTIEKDRNSYASVAQIEEYAYWIGATIAAVCSVFAGLSIAGGAGENWKFIVAALAVVPAVWAAIDRTLKLRQLSAHNYRFAAANEALLVQARAQFADAETQQLAKQYADIVRTENVYLTAILTPDEMNPRVDNIQPQASHQNGQTPS